ncbi:hypothetical protein BDR07DRAFT_1479773 [Suillus spraguei]|nr:hypothetical protein BDR07DRAFT_1479773 [Suillus spraguei]
MYKQAKSDNILQTGTGTIDAAFTHIMHSDTTAKRVPKVSAKEKAALDELASKKHQADCNVDSVNIQPKKVKKSNPPARTAHKNITVSSKDSGSVMRSSPMLSRQAVVDTEDEEEELHSPQSRHCDPSNGPH